MMPRVVLDTSVPVSGLLRGTATDVIRRWRAGGFDLVLSEEILVEYEAALSRPQYKLPPWVVRELLDLIRAQARRVVRCSDLGGEPRDPADTKLLKAVLAGQAVGTKHLDWRPPWSAITSSRYSVAVGGVGKLHINDACGARRPEIRATPTPETPTCPTRRPRQRRVLPYYARRASP